MRQISGFILTDISTSDEFIFERRCAQCGRKHQSKAMRFSRSGVSPGSSGKTVIFDALRRREKDAAEERAAAELMTHFNVCPICGRAVCDRCFLMCEDLDMCVNCAGVLDEIGEPVAT